MFLVQSVEVCMPSALIVSSDDHRTAPNISKCQCWGFAGIFTTWYGTMRLVLFEIKLLRCVNNLWHYCSEVKTKSGISLPSSALQDVQFQQNSIPHSNLLGIFPPGQGARRKMEHTIYFRSSSTLGVIVFFWKTTCQAYAMSTPPSQLTVIPPVG